MSKQPEVHRLEGEPGEGFCIMPDGSVQKYDASQRGTIPANVFRVEDVEVAKNVWSDDSGNSLDIIAPKQRSGDDNGH